jgi:CRP-like cAMP-binding protein/thioredoxin reductase/Fe-S-cluster-containing hydrogenase component 2
MSERFRIAIVGSGPSGLSAAAHAAELGVSHVLLEAEDHPSHTIYRYQKGKHVMAEPGILPLRSPMSFEAGKREEILEKWDAELAKYKVNIRYKAPVTGMTGAKGAFALKVGGSDTVEAEHVILCIGLQGNLRKLGVPGEDLEMVQYQLDDPEAYVGETIVVVGAGDAAIENAVALAEGNTVIMLNRNDEFTRCKQGNLDLVMAAVREGRIDCKFGTKPVKVEAIATDGHRGVLSVQTPQGPETIACDRIIARLGATPPRKLVESLSVRFPNDDPNSVPQLSGTYESNVPGVYIIGALGGYPLIKQAMNQGYEVVEYILGNPVEPADEPLLKDKFRNYKSVGSVAEALERIQKNVGVFSELTTLQLRELMLDSDVRTPGSGETIFEKGDYSNTFFTIVEGEVLFETVDKEGKQKNIPIPRGAFFGEIGLLSGRRRTGTVKAGGGCVLVETPRRTMLKLLSSVEAVRRQIDEAFLKRAVRSNIAPWITDGDLTEMVSEAEFRQYNAGAVLFSEGDSADGLHLIRRGSVTVSRVLGGKEVVLSYVAAGNYVGEMALLSDAKRSATVRAAVGTETILLKASKFNEVLMRNATMRGGIEARVLERIAANAARENEPDLGNLINFLMKQGVGEATDVLLIDESLCVRCDNCEKACADSHDGTSRLDREAGPTFANIHVPTSCRHCENPHCMKDCPPDAIQRSPEGEVVIQDTCIGCGNCQRNCPYGVIQLAPVSNRRFRPSLWAWLLTGLTTEPGREVKKYSKDQQKHAVKCDMCKDLSGGPACVRACPTGAALRVSPEKFLDYTAH